MGDWYENVGKIISLGGKEILNRWQTDYATEKCVAIGRLHALQEAILPKSTLNIKNWKIKYKTIK